MQNNVVIVILNYNDKKNTIRLTKTIEKFSIIDKVVVVDNCSPNNDIKDLKKLQSKKVDVIKSDKNGGYSYGNNYALKYIEKNYKSFKYVIISNPDIEVSEDAIIKTIEYLEQNKSIALAAPRIVDQSGNKYILSGWKIRKIWDDIFLQSKLTTKLFVKGPWKRMYDEEYRDQEYSVCGCVSGAFFVIKGDIFKKINYFDDKLFLFGEEDVIGKKVHDLGYNACVLNNCSVVHYESVSINRCYDMPQKLKILYKSLRHYYKEYDETVNFFHILMYDLIYYYGKLENSLNNTLNKLTIYKKIKYFLKKIYQKIKTNKRLKRISNVSNNSKKNVLILTNYWEENLLGRKNIGAPSWLANDIINNYNDEFNFFVMYTVGCTYRITLYIDGICKSYVVGCCEHEVKCNNNYYNKIIGKLIDKLKVDIVHMTTMINHFPSLNKVIEKKKNVKLIISIADMQFLNPYSVYHNTDSHSQKLKQKDLKDWNNSIQKLFNISNQVIFPNDYSLNKYKDVFKIERGKVVPFNFDTIRSSYDCKLSSELNIAFIGCIQNKNELKFIDSLINYIDKKTNVMNFYYYGNYFVDGVKQEKNVTWIGEYKRDDLSELISNNNINLVCFFKKNDTIFSYTLHEALSLGIPVLSFNNGLFSKIINDNNYGWIIDENSSYDDVYKKLHNILENKKDYNQKKKSIKKYNVVQSDQTFDEVYKEVLNEKE